MNPVYRWMDLPVSQVPAATILFSSSYYWKLLPDPHVYTPPNYPPDNPALQGGVPVLESGIPKAPTLQGIATSAPNQAPKANTKQSNIT